MGAGLEPIRFLPPDGGHAVHPVVLSGLRRPGDGQSKAPLLVERRDQDFVEGLWDDLRDQRRRDDLFGAAPKSKTPRGYDKPLPRLFAPVQRVFNLVVLEGFCNHPGLVARQGHAAQLLQPGVPRLDPEKIESSGMVLRRVLTPTVDGARYEAWVKSGTRVCGWEPIDPDHEDDDPSADRRMPAVSVGQPDVNARLPANLRRRTALALRLAGQAAPVYEHVTPLFVAPPDVNAASGKTVLFGVVQVASNEQSENPARTPGYGSDAQERQLLKDHLSNYIKAGGPRVFPRAAESFDSAWALGVGRAGPGSAAFKRNEDLKKNLNLNFTGLLQQLSVEFDAFGSSPAARTLFDRLNALQVEYDRGPSGVGSVKTYESAGNFFKRASQVLLFAEEGASFTMPDRMSYISVNQAEALFAAILRALDEQYKKLKPAKGRFEADSREAEARYVLRAFVRLKSEHAGCPGRIVWSPVSEEFTIAPWFESAGQPATMVELPDLFDRAALKTLKPNVAFTLPPKLAKLIAGDPMDLRDGKGDEGNGLGLGWICSFSIPIITICAFIVLSIFLSLFNLIFWWLPFLKICIPFPKKQP